MSKNSVQEKIVVGQTAVRVRTDSWAIGLQRGLGVGEFGGEKDGEAKDHGMGGTGRGLRFGESPAEDQPKIIVAVRVSVFCKPTR